jgi:hypothetical protein
MMRVALFTLTGVLFLGHWLLADPSFEVSEAITDTKYVLLFSAALLTLALALAVFGRMLGGRWVLRFSFLAGAGTALGSIANVVEDGFDMDWAFWGFILSLLIINPALVALSVVIALTARGAHRLLALIPAATLTAIVLYVYLGGPLMLAAWLAAAAVVLVLPTRTTAPALTTP